MKLLGAYAYRQRKNLDNEFRPGEGLVGQCMLERERILINNVPRGLCLHRLRSGRGAAAEHRRAAGAV